MKVGSMVKASYIRSGVPGPEFVGIIVNIEKVNSLFSEKYAIMETNTYVRVLSGGQLMTFDMEEDNIEVINENR